jgi:hypothetical protein
LTEEEEAEKGRLLRQQQEEDNIDDGTIDDGTHVDFFPPTFCKHGMMLDGCVPSGRGKDSDNIFEETPEAFKIAETRKVLVVMGNSLKRTSNGTGLDWLRGCKNFLTFIVVVSYISIRLLSCSCVRTQRLRETRWRSGRRRGITSASQGAR